MSDSGTPRTTAYQDSLFFTVSWGLLKLMSMESMMPSNHLILCCPPSCPAFSLSQHQGLFQWVDSLHQVAKVLELERQQQSFQWIFRVDFLQNWLVWFPCSPKDSDESSPAPPLESINSLAFSLLYGPTFNLHVTTGKTIAFTKQTFFSKVMSLLFNMLSSFVIPFLPRSKHLLISLLQSLSTVILDSKKINLSLFPCFPHLFVMKWLNQMPWS